MTTNLAVNEQVRAAAHAFAQALADTTEFRTFEDKYLVFKQDGSAQAAVREFGEAQQSLGMVQRLGITTPDQQDELNHLHTAMMSHPSVQAYVQAQDELMGLCQSAVKAISDGIRYDFAGACRSSCGCGDGSDANGSSCCG